MTYFVSYTKFKFKEKQLYFSTANFFDTDNCSIQWLVVRYRHNKQTLFQTVKSSQQISLRIDIFTLSQEILQLFSHHIAGVATYMLPGFLMHNNNCMTDFTEREREDCSLPATHPPAAHYRFTFP